MNADTEINHPVFSSDNRLLALARTANERLPASWKTERPGLITFIIVFLAFALPLPCVLLSQLIGIIPWVVVNFGEIAAAFASPTPDLEAVSAAMTPTTAAGLTLVLVGSFGMIFGLLALWLRLAERRGLWTVGLERRGWLTKYGRGLLVGLLMFGASVGISAALGYIAFESANGQPQGVAALGGVLLVFLGWMVQGAGEEVLFRGWMLPIIGRRLGLVIAIAFSSLLFAAFHLLNPNVSGLAVVNLVLFGVFAAAYALWEESLWGVFAIHSVWNWAQGNLFGFEVSGQAATGGTLFNLQEVGPDVVTGGKFGPEGGLAVTAVLLISIVLVWLAGRRRGIPNG